MPAETAKTHPQEGFLRSRDEDRAVADLARRQHGVVERGQLMEVGVGDGAISARLRSGRLHRVHAGIYAVGHSLLTPLGRWMAAVLASGPDAVLSHRSAAALWGIRPSPHAIVDVTLPHKGRSWDGVRRHHKPLPADEVGVEEGIPVTSVPRTVLDVAAQAPEQVVEAMLREVEYRRLWDRLSLWDLLRRYPGRRGTRKVRLALERLEELPAGRFRSPLEERFLPFLRRHQLPAPRFNDWILLGEKRFQVDCHWPDTRHIVELDGWSAHGTRSAFREDRARDRALRVAGYSVTRIVWAQLEDEPQAIAADLRSLLSS
jgi:very-short-patch-repair endonuclease